MLSIDVLFFCQAKNWVNFSLCISHMMRLEKLSADICSNWASQSKIFYRLDDFRFHETVGVGSCSFSEAALSSLCRISPSNNLFKIERWIYATRVTVIIIVSKLKELFIPPQRSLNLEKLGLSSGSERMGVKRTLE